MAESEVNKLKKRKNSFAMILLSLLLSLSLLSSTVVYAGGKDDAEIEDTASKSLEPTAHINGTYLSEGTAGIARLSSTELHVMGVTNCARISEKVYLYLYLERKVDGHYLTYKSWKFTKEDTGSLLKGIDVKVPSGYYYRVRGYHAAECNGTKESVSTLTSGIMID